MFGFTRKPTVVPVVRRHRAQVTPEKRRDRIAENAFTQAMADDPEVRRAHILKNYGIDIKSSQDLISKAIDKLKVGRSVKDRRLYGRG